MSSPVSARERAPVSVVSLADGRIADARHYFSDLQLLVSVGILERDDLKRSTTAQGS